MQLLNIQEAAKETRMSPSWWRMMVFKRAIKFLKIGRRVLIPRSTIDELLNQSVVEPRTRPDSTFDRGVSRK
ncbi:MAG: helix-turn-helix domain-containing protein [Desulfomonilaceae bacterium]